MSNQDTAGTSIRSLDLSDLDQVVGGAGSAASVAATAEDPSKDQAFMQTLGNVAHVVSAAANDIHNASGGWQVDSAIQNVVSQAGAWGVSMDAALAGLLGATGDNQQANHAISQELGQRMLGGAAQQELAHLVRDGRMDAATAVNITQVAIGAIAAHSGDGTVMGMSHDAALAQAEQHLQEAAQQMAGGNAYQMAGAIAQSHADTDAGGPHQLTHGEVAAVLGGNTWWVDNLSSQLHSGSFDMGQLDQLQQQMNWNNYGNPITKDSLLVAVGALSEDSSPVHQQAVAMLTDRVLSGGLEHEISTGWGPFNMQALKSADAIVSVVVGEGHTALDSAAGAALAVALSRLDGVAGTQHNSFVQQFLDASGQAPAVALDQLTHGVAAAINSGTTLLQGTDPNWGMPYQKAAQVNAAIEMVTSAAAASGVSALEAMTNLLRETGGDHDIAARVSGMLLGGGGDIVSMVEHGKLTGEAALDVAKNAIDTLAQFSADGRSVFGMSTNAALAIVADKFLGAAVHLEGLSGIGELSTGYSSLRDSVAWQFQHEHTRLLEDAQRITMAVGGEYALAQGLAQSTWDVGKSALDTEFGKIASVAEILHGNTRISVADALSVANVSLDAIHWAIGNADYYGSHWNQEVLLTAVSYLSAGNEAMHQLTTSFLTERLLSGDMQRDLLEATRLDTGFGVEKVTGMLESVVGTLADKGGTALGFATGDAVNLVIAKLDVVAGGVAADLGGYAGNAVSQLRDQLEQTHTKEILTGLGLNVAQAAVHAQERANAILTSGIVGAKDAANEALHAGQEAVQDSIAAAQRVTRAQVDSVYNTLQNSLRNVGDVANSLQNAGDVSQGRTSDPTVFDRALASAASEATDLFEKGFDAATNSKDGRFVTAIMSNPSNLQGYADLAERLTGKTFAHDAILAAGSPATAISFLLDQDAVSSVLGQHATGALKDTLLMVNAVNQGVINMSSAYAEVGIQATTPLVEAQIHLLENMATIGDHIFTGDFGALAGDADRLANAYVENMNQFANRASEVPQQLYDITTRELGHTFSAMAEIARNSPYISAAVNWTTEAGQTVASVMEHVGGDAKDAFVAVATFYENKRLQEAAQAAVYAAEFAANQALVAAQRAEELAQIAAGALTDAYGHVAKGFKMVGENIEYGVLYATDQIAEGAHYAVDQAGHQIIEAGHKVEAGVTYAWDVSTGWVKDRANEAKNFFEDVGSWFSSW